jgi:uncharacterized membrane protein
MTDKERQQLCDWLRHLPAYLSEEGMRAADVIERLEKERDSALAALRTTQKQYEEMGERALLAERLAALAQGLESESVCRSYDTIR